MRIPAFIQKWGGGERSAVIVGVYFPKFGFGTRTITRCIIDNGCPVTIISKTDLERIRAISSRKFDVASKINLGGLIIDLIDLDETILTFRDKDNNLVEVKHKVWGGELPFSNVFVIQAIPSIIGMDFLREHRGSIGFDENSEPYLEINKP